MSHSYLQKPLEFSVSFSLTFTEVLFVGSHTETLTCIPYILLISQLQSVLACHVHIISTVWIESQGWDLLKH